MEANLMQASVCLEPRCAISLTDAAGAEVTCLTGRIRLTMGSDSRDIVLAKGDAYTVERNGLTLVNAAEPSRLQVRVGQARRGAWRGWLTRLWDWLVQVGEARARARMRRGIYY